MTIPASGSGQLVTVPGTAGPTGPGTRMTYRLEIEGGLPLDGAAVAAQVQRTLTDPRGWQPIEHVAFVRTPGPASFELILASPTMVDRLCYPLDTVGELSCRNGNRVILNAKRWVDAVPWYRGPPRRLPRLPGQPRGRAPARARPRELPGARRPGPGHGAAEQVALRLRAQPWPSVAA